MARIKPPIKGRSNFPPLPDARRRPPEPKKSVSDLLQENLPLISRLITGSVYLENKNIQELIDELKNGETVEERKKAIVEDLYKDLYYILNHPQSNLEEDRQDFISFLTDLETKIIELGLDLAKFKAEVDAELKEDLEILKEGNHIVITDPDLADLLEVEQGQEHVLVLKVSKVNKSTGQQEIILMIEGRQYPMDRQDLEGKYDLGAYAEIEPPPEPEAVPFPRMDLESAPPSVVPAPVADPIPVAAPFRPAPIPSSFPPAQGTADPFVSPSPVETFSPSEEDFIIPRPGETKEVRVDGQVIASVFTEDGNRFVITPEEGAKIITRGEARLRKQLDELKEQLDRDRVLVR